MHVSIKSGTRIVEPNVSSCHHGRYQASQEIFEVFDKVLVLQKEDDPSAPSQMVYFGSTDSNDLEEFFSSVGYEKPPEYTWPDCTFVGPCDV